MVCGLVGFKKKIGIQRKGVVEEMNKFHSTSLCPIGIKLSNKKPGKINLTVLAIQPQWGAIQQTRAAPTGLYTSFHAPQGIGRAEVVGYLRA